MIIAIDGHSSCGKSTVAKSLATILGYLYIDTGAMYRAVTLYCIRHGLIHDETVDETTLSEYLDKIHISFAKNPEKGSYEVVLNGEFIEQEIRGMLVSNLVSSVSKIKPVRDKLVLLQRQISVGQNIIMDGRDIGTVVFPNADVKIFMTARPEIRAKRRYDELTAKGEVVAFDEILANVVERDYQDEHRAESPLKKANDALVLDNSSMTRDEQLNWIVAKIDEKTCISK